MFLVGHERGWNLEQGPDKWDFSLPGLIHMTLHQATSLTLLSLGGILTLQDSYNDYMRQCVYGE